jgi:hypothetical protein
MSRDHYSQLLRTGRANGHDATPDDYDAALKDAAEVQAWALARGLDRVAAVAQGLVTALLVIDPRQPPY